MSKTALDIEAMRARWDAAGKWVYIVPIKGVILTEAVNREFRIKEVLFVHKEKLPRIRRRLGIPRQLSELRSSKWSGGILDVAETYAVVRASGSPTEARRRSRRIVRKELSLLAVSQVGYASRRQRVDPAIKGEGQSSIAMELLIESKGSRMLPSGRLSGSSDNIAMHGAWLRFQRDTLFLQLLEIIRGHMGTSRKWTKDIERAAVMAGRSVCAQSMDMAFLWNMIALETLFVDDQGTFRSTFPSVAEAFLGWSGFWHANNYENRIRDVYGKRNKLVHTGRADDISATDLLFTDDLVFHLLWNLVAHIQLFPNRESVLEFSKRVEAEHVLGLKGRVRPRTLQYALMRRDAKDLEDD
jgi:hypothetical protein